MGTAIAPFVPIVGGIVTLTIFKKRTVFKISPWLFIFMTNCQNGIPGMSINMAAGFLPHGAATHFGKGGHTISPGVTG